ncbi:hypothetical protein EE612_053146, partial [Oryza sativa]
EPFCPKNAIASLSLCC